MDLASSEYRAKQRLINAVMIAHGISKHETGPGPLQVQVLHVLYAGQVARKTGQPQFAATVEQIAAVLSALDDKLVNAPSVNAAISGMRNQRGRMWVEYIPFGIVPHPEEVTKHRQWAITDRGRAWALASREIADVLNSPHETSRQPDDYPYDRF